MMSGNSNPVTPSNESMTNRTNSEGSESSGIPPPQNETTNNQLTSVSDASVAGQNNYEPLSSSHFCPIVQDPPAQGAAFLQHPQIFEYSAIYRHIAISGVLTSVRTVRHPLT